jgi:hypothetical protein
MPDLIRIMGNDIWPKIRDSYPDLLPSWGPNSRFISDDLWGSWYELGYLRHLHFLRHGNFNYVIIMRESGLLAES